MVTDTVTLQDFVRAHRISMTAERTSSNPNMADSTSMDHWKAVFTRYQDFTKTGDSVRFHGKVLARMTTYFSMGYGHNGSPPSAEDVLDCLSSDASSVEYEGFFGWADDMGYDHDSRKAEKIYKACVHNSKRLKKFLGDDEAFNQLLYGTEHL